jgi:hypothetical protein
MKRRVVVSLASVVLCCGAVAIVQAGAATKTLSASGGSLNFSANVRNAKTCTWSSTPKIAGFAKTVPCKNGVVARSADFKSNSSTNEKSYVVTLSVRGSTAKVNRWDVIQAGQVLPPITTTTVPTATVPSPCNVGACTITFSGPDIDGATEVSVDSVTQNAVDPDPAIDPTPAGDQLDEVTVSMKSGSTGMGEPAVEIFHLALALAGGSQGAVDLVTYDTRTPSALGTFGPVAPNSPLTAVIYYDVPIGSTWTSVNFALDYGPVYAFLP